MQVYFNDASFEILIPFLIYMYILSMALSIRWKSPGVFNAMILRYCISKIISYHASTCLILLDQRAIKCYAFRPHFNFYRHTVSSVVKH